MKSHLIPFSFLIFLLSCKKDADFSGCDITQADMYSSGVFQNSTTYSYDDQHRLKTITNGNEVITHQYFTDSVIVSLPNYGTTYYLNAAGLAVSAKDFRTGPNPNQLKSEFLYTYNSEGYVTQKRYIFSQLYNGNILKDTSFENHTISNGNIVKISGTNMTDINFEYSNLVVKNRFPETKPFLGKPSVNAIIAAKDNSGNVITRYSYITNTSGNVIQSTSTQVSNGDQIRTDFQYTCK